jgi:UDP:flavonoid glycosyltransferase YjiC (YdhE family)
MTEQRTLRVVLATIGSRGDVQPMLALAQTLQARGHTPLVVAPPNFRAWVQGLGFEFAPLGVDMQVFIREHPEMMTGNPLKMGRGFLQYFKAQLLPQAVELHAACLGADALVYAGLAFFSGASVAQALRLPAMCLQFTTALLPSGLHPPTMLPVQGLPAWLNRLAWMLERRMGNSAMRDTLNSMRESLGLPPVANIWTHLMDGPNVLIAADATLLPPDQAWPERFAYANFLYFDDPARMDPDLDAWLRDGEAPVFIGFGSMSGAATARMENLMIDAIGAIGRRCLVGSGWSGLGSGQLPQGWRVVRDVPHAPLFARAAVVVHHGGSGTTAQALRAGVPQVVLPLLLDQFHHAHRLYVNGLAPRPVPLEKVSARQLTEAIGAALALPAGPREVVRDRLRAADARVDIAQRVERMAAS